MPNTSLTLIPYVHFNGNCEEALNTYKKVFNGSYEAQRYGDAPMQVPDSHKQKILHARFQFGNNTIMTSDVFPGQQVSDSERVMLSVGLTDEAEARRIFEQLSEGGQVTMPLEKQFWGALFGQLTDRFGIRWMINCENK